MIVAGILRVEGTLARGNSRVQQCDRWGQGGVRLEGGQGCAGGRGGWDGGEGWPPIPWAVAHPDFCGLSPAALCTVPGPHGPGGGSRVPILQGRRLRSEREKWDLRSLT